MNNNEIFVGMCYIYEKLGLNRKKKLTEIKCVYYLILHSYDAQAWRRIGLKIERDWNFWKEIPTLF